MKREAAILIPARLNSARLPKKALIQVRGKSILQWTYESAIKLGYPTYVVTEDGEIADEVTRFGGQFILNHRAVENGTEAIKYILAQNPIELDWRTTNISTVINIQGDCPVFDADLAHLIIKKCNSYKRSIVTGFYNTKDQNIINSPSNVKIATSFSARKQCQSRALYFSRSPIPFNAGTYKIHVGMYGFNRWDVSNYNYTGNPENLEQLNWLSQGYDIRCFEGKPSISIDVPEDLEKLERYLHESKS